MKMTKPCEVIKDLHWVEVSRVRGYWNEFHIDFNVPSYDFAYKEPLPKNTALKYDIPPIRFLYRLVHPDPSFEMEIGKVIPFIEKISQKVCDSLTKEMRRKLEKTLQITFLDLFFYPDFIDYEPEIGSTKGKTPSDKIKFPIKAKGYLRGNVCSFFRPPLESSEIVRMLLEAKEFYYFYTETEVKELFRRYYNDVGFTVEDCGVFIEERPKGLVFHAPEFYYLPRTLDEWKEREIDPIHFVVIFPKSKDIVRSFINVVSSCETITELSRKVLFYINMFRENTEVIRIKLSPWDNFGMWLIGIEANIIEERFNNRSDDYIFLKEVFTWVGKVVEGDDPSPNDQLTNDNNLVGTEESSRPSEIKGEQT